MPVVKVRPIEGPKGLDRYSLTLPPDYADVSRVYGAQCTVDSFWPDNAPLTRLPDPVNGDVHLEGIVGDPNAVPPERAMLVGRKVGQFGIRRARLIQFDESE